MQDLTPMRGRGEFTGMDLRQPPLDFVRLAQGFGLAAQRLTRPADIGAALHQAFRSGQPSLVDIQVADGFGG